MKPAIPRAENASLALIDKNPMEAPEKMRHIKNRYTLAEAAEYLRRETMTPDVSIHDVVTLAAQGELSVCFPYKGQLGLFENGDGVTPTHAEIAKSIFGRALKTVYFNGVLRSLSRPAPDNEITNRRNETHKAHTLHPVRVVPICVFASDPPVELGEPEGHHWRRVHGSRDSWAGGQLIAGIPKAEWMIETESLHRLADANAEVAKGYGAQPRLDLKKNHNPTNPKLKELSRRVISSKTRRDTLRQC